MALSADDVKSAEFDYLLVFLLPLIPVPNLWVAAEDDVHSSPRHVGGNGHRPQTSGLGDDKGLLFVVFGIEHLMRNTFHGEHFAQALVFFDGHRPHQGRSLLS